MPEISRFFGILIKMYFSDHNPPHFHASYGDYQALYSIETAEMFEGDMPKKQNRLVQAWAEIHKQELEKNWRSLQGETGEIIKIEPLQ
jgi:hypothetical protein